MIIDNVENLLVILKEHIVYEVDRQLTEALGKRDEPAKLQIEVKVVE